MSKNNMRNSLRSKLSSSLKEEEKKVQNRFETAENLLLRATNTPQNPTPQQVTEVSKEISELPAPSPQKKIKIKVVTFKIPEEEDGVLDALVLQAARAGKLVNRSQVLRAGLVALSKTTTEDYLCSIESLMELKPGRPSN